MRNAFILIVVAVAALFLASCHKCYECHNQREVCTKLRFDTTLTILVSSQNLSQEYYTQYIDSLTSPSLGWVCHDTTSDYSQEYCPPTGKSGSSGLANEEAIGLICSPK
jgi:hypothetical protein